MAYARFARDCDWYVYCYALSDERGEEQLAVSHASARGQVHLLSRGEVVARLATHDSSGIPGRTPAHDALLETCFREFLEDVSRES